MPPLPCHVATRYVTPLREGGSLPAVVDTHDAGLWVVKFRGAGQGAKALIAEVIVGELARAAGLPVPEIAGIEIIERFGRSEPDSEIQEILQKSHGVNVGLRYLDGAFNFDPNAAGDVVDAELAARIVWFDAFTTNPDRSHRNPNLLVWQRRPWLIDHGAALYAHHDWASVDVERARTPFPRIQDHVLLTASGDLEDADRTLTAALDDATVDAVLARVPDALLTDSVGGREFATGDEARARYRDYLLTRLRAPRDFVAQAIEARERRRKEPPKRLHARR
jgi:hypothetical protein